MNEKKVNVQMLEPQPNNGIRTIDTTSSQTIAKHLVSGSFSAEDMAKAWSEGYHCKVDEIKGIKPVKFREWLKNYCQR